MSGWSHRYKATTERTTSLRPIYIMLLGQDSSVLRNSESYTDTAFWTDTDDAFEPIVGPALTWNDSGWEMLHVYGWDDPSDRRLYVLRDEYGTEPIEHIEGETIMSVGAAFSTAPIDGTTMPHMSNVMSYPHGGGQSLDFLHGRLKTDDVSVDVQDKDGRVTALLKANPLVGKQTVILAGYEGFEFKDYSIINVGVVDSVEVVDGTVYNFQISDVTRRLNKTLFSYLDDYPDTNLTNAVMSDSVTQAYLDDETIVPDTLDTTIGATDGYDQHAGHCLKIDDEYCRVHGNNGVVCTVVRGCHGTTATSHANNTATSLHFICEDNRIDLLLGLLLSGNDEVPDSAVIDPEGVYRYSWKNAGDADFGDVGLRISPNEIDFTSFENIRELWHIDEVDRHVFSRKTKLKPYFEKHMMMPYNLCFKVSSTGKLGLATSRQQISSSATVLDDDDIIGIPNITISAAELVNEVTVYYDWDSPNNEFTGTPVTVVDAASQVKYDTDVGVDIEAKGAIATGSVIGPRLGTLKKALFRVPNPTLPIPAMFKHSAIDPGDVVRVTIDNLPDVQAGTIGWDKYMLVTGKRPNWHNGRLEFDVIDTSYAGQRHGLIAPSGQVDYDSATTAEKETYAFISDASDKMSDDTEGYSIS